MASLAQFVDSIAATPSVRLDLNSRASKLMVGVAGLNLSPPPMRRTVTANMISDGDQITGSTHGNRTLGVPLQLVDALSADDAAATMQALARELDRPRNILKLQLDGMTAPVFFRTYRAPDYTMSMLRLMFAAKTEAVLGIPAEPYGLGVRETLTPVTVANNPASANGMFLDVTNVKGDVETPAFLEYTIPGGANARTLIAPMRRGNPANGIFLLQAEDMSLGPDTADQANDAAFSGTGNNWSRCTFATDATMATRLSANSGFWPGTNTSEIIGTYRVFVRVRRNTATATAMAMRLFMTVGGINVFGTTVTSWVAGSAEFALVDLGLVHIPASDAPREVGPSGVLLTCNGLDNINVQAQRVSGATNLDFDYLLFVPADPTERTLVLRYPGGNTGQTIVVDGVNEKTYETSAGVLQSERAHEAAGRFPMLTPGSQVNRLYFLRSTGAGPDVLSATDAVTVSYWPRYLHVRPATS